jgi:hypothetical protein
MSPSQDILSNFETSKVLEFNIVFSVNFNLNNQLVSVGPSRRTDRLTKLSKTKGRLILYTCKVVETAEVRGKGVSGVKGGQSATN